jgi:transcriptional regulator with XRE-family HTH domain
VKRFSYGERDYAFGQLMLTLRTTIGLSQAALGGLLGVSRRAVAEWEGGLSYPKAERLKQLITLGVQQRAWASGANRSRSARCGRRPTRRCCWMRTGCGRCSLRP